MAPKWHFLEEKWFCVRKSIFGQRKPSKIAVSVNRTDTSKSKEALKGKISKREFYDQKMCILREKFAQNPPFLPPNPSIHTDWKWWFLAVVFFSVLAPKFGLSFLLWTQIVPICTRKFSFHFKKCNFMAPKWRFSKEKRFCVRKSIFGKRKPAKIIISVKRMQSFESKERLKGKTSKREFSNQKRVFWGRNLP